MLVAWIQIYEDLVDSALIDYIGRYYMIVPFHIVFSRNYLDLLYASALTDVTDEWSWEKISTSFTY